MLESGLFFALGFFFATLIALLAAPAIWRRAVYLTQKKIESSVPLSLEEIQASKDQLRARFAKDSRNLETKIEKLSNQSAEQLIELNKLRGETLMQEEHDVSRSAKIVELEASKQELGQLLQKSEERLSETEARLKQVEQKHDQVSAAFQELDEKFRGAVDEFDGQKIEMVARETRMDTLLDEVSETKKTAKELSTERSQLAKDLKAASAALNKEHDRNEELAAKLAELQASHADMEGRLERRELDLKKLRGKTGSSQLDEILRENENLHQEISSLRNIGHNAGAGMEDIAAVRDQLSDLAARVTAAAAAQDGPNSTIAKALNKTKKAPSKRGAKSTGTAKGAKTTRSKKAAPSLADRIKELQ